VSVRVQRVGAAPGGEVSYTVLGADGLPVDSVEAYLAHLSVVGRAPNTVAGYAHDLRDFVEWLGLRGLDYRAVSLEQVGEFFGWLRRPKPARRPGVFALPSAPPAVVGRTLLRKRAALAGFYRFHARREGRTDPVLGELATGTGEFVPMLAHTRHGRRDAVAASPLRIADCSGPVVRDVAPEAFERLVAACDRPRPVPAGVAGADRAAAGRGPRAAPW
jgi:integrase/recombinase XerD